MNAVAVERFLHVKTRALWQVPRTRALWLSGQFSLRTILHSLLQQLHNQQQTTLDTNTISHAMASSTKSLPETDCITDHQLPDAVFKIELETN